MWNKFLVLSSLVLLCSCESLPDWLGSSEEPPLPGERFAVMEDQSKLKVAPELESETIEIPEASTQPSSGTSSGNYAYSGNLDSETTVDGGDAPDSDFFLTYPPLVAENTIYVIDGISKVSAFNADNLQEKWTKQIKFPESDEDLPGGGLGYAYGVIYASTGAGYVVAMSATDGGIVWKKDLGMPLRRPPVVEDDKVFAVTIDNQLFALSVVDGETLWRQSGVKESTSFYGSASPVVKNGVVVVAYSSGEVFGVGTNRGQELWTELIALGSDRRSAGSNLNDVSASPVIVDGISYIGGHSGDLGAFNASNGSRIWQQKLGSIDTTPWVAGKYIFVVVQSNKVVALNRYDGRIKWVANLPKIDTDEKTVWSGPVMAGGNLVVVNSGGLLAKLDPQNGKVLKTSEVSEGIYTAPIIANNSLYMLTREAKIVRVK